MNENLECVMVYAAEKNKKTGLHEVVSIDICGFDNIERVKNGEAIVIADNSAAKTTINYTMDQWKENLCILVDKGFIDEDEMDELIASKSVADFPGHVTTTNCYYKQKCAVNPEPSDTKTNESKDPKGRIPSAKFKGTKMASIGKEDVEVNVPLSKKATLDKILAGEPVHVEVGYDYSTVLNYTKEQWIDNLKVLISFGWTDMDTAIDLISSKSVVEFPGSDIGSNFDGDEDPLYPKAILEKVNQTLPAGCLKLAEIFYYSSKDYIDDIFRKPIRIDINGWLFSFEQCMERKNSELKLSFNDQLCFKLIVPPEAGTKEFFEVCFCMMYNSEPNVRSTIDLFGCVN